MVAARAAASSSPFPAPGSSCRVSFECAARACVAEHFRTSPTTSAPPRWAPRATVGHAGDGSTAAPCREPGRWAQLLYRPRDRPPDTRKRTTGDDSAGVDRISPRPPLRNAGPLSLAYGAPALARGAVSSRAPSCARRTPVAARMYRAALPRRLRPGASPARARREERLWGNSLLKTYAFDVGSAGDRT